MTLDPDYAQHAADLIDALDSPTPAQARAITDRFNEADLIAAMLAGHGVGGGGGGSSPWQEHTVILSGADVISLASGTVELVPAPGAGKAIVPLQLLFHVLPGETGFDSYTRAPAIIGSAGWSTSGTGIVIPTDAGSETLAGSNIPVSSNQASIVDMEATYAAPADVENQPLLFGPAGVSPSVGDGTVKVTTIFYLWTVA